MILDWLSLKLLPPASVILLNYSYVIFYQDRIVSYLFSAKEI